MSFQKAGDPLVHGKRQLLYYIGQGRRGTTYLFSVDGYYFRKPDQSVLGPPYLGHGSSLWEYHPGPAKLAGAAQLHGLSRQWSAAAHRGY